GEDVAVPECLVAAAATRGDVLLRVVGGVVGRLERQLPAGARTDGDVELRASPPAAQLVGVVSNLGGDPRLRGGAVPAAGAEPPPRGAGHEGSATRQRRALRTELTGHGERAVPEVQPGDVDVRTERTVLPVAGEVPLVPLVQPDRVAPEDAEIGRASCRERV